MRLIRVKRLAILLILLLCLLSAIIYYENQPFLTKHPKIEWKRSVKSTASLTHANVTNYDEKRMTMEYLLQNFKSFVQVVIQKEFSKAKQMVNSTYINQKLEKIERNVESLSQQQKQLLDQYTKNKPPKSHQLKPIQQKEISKAKQMVNSTYINQKLEKIERNVESLSQQQKQLLDQYTKNKPPKLHQLKPIPHQEIPATKGKEIKHGMMLVHDRVYNKLTRNEIQSYYDRERMSQRIFGNRHMDLTKDRSILMTLFPKLGERNDRITDQLRVNFTTTKEKVIYFRSSSMINPNIFREDQCNVNQCKLTRKMGDLSQADAIYTAVPLPKSFRKIRKQHQVWVYSQLESAKNFPRINILELNWTATYRRDSVLNTPYERFTPFLNVTDLPRKPKRNFAKGKRKQVAWYVSNCAGSNHRMSYVKELQKYINVDIYGMCGHLHCRKDDKRCFEQLTLDYKFYLAFENSNCKDYVTEKFFWNGLKNDVIPIVMGAHPDEYKHIAPPNSYIHVDEFESPQLLAQYLHFLDQHDDLYNKYFLWKDTGSFINTKFMCRLCMMLHLAPLFPMWYTNSNEWWSNKDICVKPTLQNGIFYSTWRRKKPSYEFTNDIHYDYDRNIL